MLASDIREINNKMNKTILVVTIFCLSFTFWWTWELDAGPFIYRHTVPEKLAESFNKQFFPYLEGRNITNIRFGRKNAHVRDKVPVAIDANERQEWLISNMSTGVVVITVSLEDKATTIYWNVPQDMPFDDAFNLLSQSMWDILTQYDQIMNVQSSYTE